MGLGSAEPCVLTAPAAAHSLAPFLRVGKPPTTSTLTLTHHIHLAHFRATCESVSRHPGLCSVLPTRRAFSHLVLSTAVINHLGT